jgi:hypothetical protein
VLLKDVEIFKFAANFRNLRIALFQQKEFTMFQSHGRLHVHFAVPFFGGDQLVRTLSRIAPNLSSAGISIPDPETYRSAFSRKARGEDGGAFMPLEIERISQAINEDADLIVLSFDDILGHPTRIFDRGVIHSDAASRIEFLRSQFPNRELSLFFTAADPGAVMAAMLSQGALTNTTAAQAISMRPLWSDLMERIDAQHPDLPITLWAQEDTPCTWPVVLREILNLPEGRSVSGGLHMAGYLLDEKGRAGLSNHLKTSPPKSERALVATLSDYLSTHAVDHKLTFDISLDGWSQEVIDDFALIYEQDLDACLDIEQMRLITTETVLEGSGYGEAFEHDGKENAAEPVMA